MPSWAQRALHGVPLDRCGALLSTASSINVGPGHVIRQAGDPVRQVFFVVRGTIRLDHQVGQSQVMFGLLGPGDLLGEMAALDGVGRLATATTTEATELVAVSAAAFQQAFEEVAELARNVARALVAEVRRADAQVVSLASMQVDQRVARQLLVFAHRYGQPDAAGTVRIPLRLTQQDLASLIGASRERTNRALVAFKRRGWIAVDRECHVTVVRQDLLAKRVGTRS